MLNSAKAVPAVFKTYAESHNKDSLESGEMYFIYQHVQLEILQVSIHSQLPQKLSTFYLFSEGRRSPGAWGVPPTFRLTLPLQIPLFQTLVAVSVARTTVHEASV